MTTNTPKYSKQSALDAYGRARDLHDQIMAMRPLGYREFATDSAANQERQGRHMDMIEQAKFVRDQMRQIVLEISNAEDKARSEAAA
ncbi:MAG TPA: hypothetical protein VMV33_00230 [Rhodocyclaceae bacterium]|nr:hypothetical protein [Rhodocyclaceae bacterium]